MEGLHVDFDDPDTTAGPNRLGGDFSRMSSTQPEAPITDVQFEWDRPWQSASQPLHTSHNFDSHDFWASLAEDPATSQFTPQPQLPLSLVSNSFLFTLVLQTTVCRFTLNIELSDSLVKTQKARLFEDICPSQRMTRFYSSYSFRQILPILGSALHRLGVAAPPFKRSDFEDGNTESWISIKTLDRRKCQLRGEILVERMAPDVLQVSFSKSVGDPLEWRRFFKVRYRISLFPLYFFLAALAY